MFGSRNCVIHIKTTDGTREADTDDEVTFQIDEKGRDFALKVIAARLARSNALARERNLFLGLILVALIILIIHFVGL